MYRVTLPSGKVYTYGPRKVAQARALAAKTGGTLTRVGQPLGPDSDDGYDAWKDARCEDGTWQARKYVR